MSFSRFESRVSNEKNFQKKQCISTIQFPANLFKTCSRDYLDKQVEAVGLQNGFSEKIARCPEKTCVKVPVLYPLNEVESLSK